MFPEQLRKYPHYTTISTELALALKPHISSTTTDNFLIVFGLNKRTKIATYPTLHLLLFIFLLLISRAEVHTE